MLDAITQATSADFDALWQFYSDVCNQQANDPYSPQWTLGVYPAEEDIRGHLEAGDLHVGWVDGVPAAAMVVTMHEDPEYADVPWITSAADDEVAVIHLLAVHPRARGQHVGSELVREAIRLSREAGKRVMHLDVVPGNQAASRIYEAEGFVHACTHQVFYEDTGLMDFDMYELAL